MFPSPHVLRCLLLFAWFPSNADVSSQFIKLGWDIVWAAVMFHSIWPPKNQSLEPIRKSGLLQMYVSNSSYL